MKKLLIILLIIIGCSNQEVRPNGWCYLDAGLYLITGDINIAKQWADQERHNWPNLEGYTTDVFYAYNNDESRCLWIEFVDTTLEADIYLNLGHLVVITYQTGPNKYHAEPYTYSHYRKIIEIIYTFDCGKIY